MAIDKVNLATVEKMWRREVEAAHTYKLLAEREHDPKRREILLRLAEQEDKHAARWAERIELATGRRPDAKEVERGLSWFQRMGDPNIVLHRLEQEGFIAGAWGTSPEGRRVKSYRITAAGRRQLSIEKRQWARIAGAVAQILDAS